MAGKKLTVLCEYGTEEAKAILTGSLALFLRRELEKAGEGDEAGAL